LLLPVARADSENEDEIKTTPQESPNKSGIEIIQQIHVIKNSIHNAIATAKDAISSSGQYYADQLVHVKTQIVDEAKKTYENMLDKIPKSIRQPPIPYYLLPPEFPKGYQHPLTVCIDLDLLIDDMPDMIRGGAEFFIVQTSQFAEIVVFSRDMSDMTLEALMEVDRACLVPYRLSCEHFYSPDQYRIPMKRDLHRLNRDLSRVVVLDYQKELYPKHADNVLLMPKGPHWTGDAYETDLFDIVPVLYHFSKEVSRGKDIREVLLHYEDVDIAKVGRIALGRKTSSL